MLHCVYESTTDRYKIFDHAVPFTQMYTVMMHGQNSPLYTARRYVVVTTKLTFDFAVSRMYLLVVCILLSDRFNIFPFEPKNNFAGVKVFLHDVERRMCLAKSTTLLPIA